MSYASIAVGGISMIGGMIGKGKARRRMKELQSQRTAYKTPEEVFKILQATQQNAQTGLGSQVLGYLTGSADRAMSSSVGAIQQMGGDLNDLSGIFEQRLQQDMKIGAQDHAAQLANFSQYLTALNSVAENRTAEWASRENILKDEIQGVAAEGADANKTFNSGLNSVLTGLGMKAAGELYGDNNNPNTVPQLGAPIYTPTPIQSTPSGAQPTIQPRTP